MTATLEGVYRKLQRARRDLQALTDSVRAFDNSQFAEPIEEIDPVDGSRVYHFRALIELDPEWGLSVGEVVYQLRSALDQLVAQLVALNGGDPEEHSGAFPISIDSAEYFKKPKKSAFPLRDRLLRGVSPADKRQVDQLQPFQRGGKRAATADPLAFLNRLCNADKHRQGHPPVIVRQEAIAHFVPNGAGAATMHEQTKRIRGTRLKPLHDGDEMFRFSVVTLSDGSISPPPQFDMGAFRFGVCFGATQLWLHDLWQIMEYVETEVVQRFVNRFPDVR